MTGVRWLCCLCERVSSPSSLPSAIAEQLLRCGAVCGAAGYKALGMQLLVNILRETGEELSSIGIQLLVNILRETGELYWDTVASKDLE